MTFDPEKIPIWLRRTPEQQAADQALQERLRQAQGPGRRPSRLEAQLIRAEAIKQSATAHLRHLYSDPEANPAHVITAEAQLADALAMEGNFRSAAVLHPNDEQSARYEAIAEAVERDDDERCNCPITTVPDPAASNRTITLVPDTIDEIVFSAKHRKLMPLVRCTQCGDMNVRPAPAQLEERMRRVQENQGNERRMRGRQ